MWYHCDWKYSGRKITDSLWNVTVWGEKEGKSKGEERCPTVCLSMYSVTENIYYSQLSSVAVFLHPEPNCCTSYNTRKRLCSLSLSLWYRLVVPPASHMSSCNGQRSSQLFFIHYNTGWYWIVRSQLASFKFYSFGLCWNDPLLKIFTIMHISL
jgi:hypothetical protein